MSFDIIGKCKRCGQIKEDVSPRGYCWDCGHDEIDEPDNYIPNFPDDENDLPDDVWYDVPDPDNGWDDENH